MYCHSAHSTHSSTHSLITATPTPVFDKPAPPNASCHYEFERTAHGCAVNPYLVCEPLPCPQYSMEAPPDGCTYEMQPDKTTGCPVPHLICPNCPALTAPNVTRGDGCTPLMVVDESTNFCPQWTYNCVVCPRLIDELDPLCDYWLMLNSMGGTNCHELHLLGCDERFNSCPMYSRVDQLPEGCQVEDTG